MSWTSRKGTSHYRVGDLRTRGDRYVDLNPVRAGIVNDATEYEWSSARPHVEGRDGLSLLGLGLWKEVSRGQDWRDALTRTGDEEVAEMGQAAPRRPDGPSAGRRRIRATAGGGLRRKLDAKRTGRLRKGKATAAAGK